MTGAGAGAVGAAIAAGILIGLGEPALSDLTVEALGVLLLPGAVFGLLYAVVASIPPLPELAAAPRTGLALGVGYGVLFWLTTLVGGPVTTSGLLAGLTFGGVVGLLYALSPYRREAPG